MWSLGFRNLEIFIVSKVIYLIATQISPGLSGAEHGAGSAGVECQPYPVPLVIYAPGGVESSPRLYNGSALLRHVSYPVSLT